CSAAFATDADGLSIAIAMEVDTRQLPIDPVERLARFEQIISTARRVVTEQHGIVLSAVSLLAVGTIPKTSSGKLRRRACRAAFVDGSLNELVRWPAQAVSYLENLPAASATVLAGA